jgi:molybdate transport system substrate-binding protein
MSSAIRIISSMATRKVLADLIGRFETASGRPVSLESVGGVDAAARVAAGEPLDGAVLAAAAIDKLIASGHVLPGSRVDVVRSPMGVAIRSGAARPDVGSEDAVRQAVASARAIGYSTGPSGTYLLDLFDRWGLAGHLKGRLVQATPGVPVASLVARGEVELGFQQLGELADVEGVDVLGPLPAPIQHMTTFSGGVTTASSQRDVVRDLLAFMASPSLAALKQTHGMEQPDTGS